jgi:uncharacterized protein YyaL (SSP411 family)
MGGRLFLKTVEKGGRRMNRLSAESSPYLLQHAHNPIDWFPWGKEALSLARELDRPIFLSIGYSSCHWCHVMERESFSQPEVGELLNRHFIPIKVDREERPDLDAQYMTAAQVLIGRGGWPLNMVLTPRRLPFFAFNYLPLKTRDGQAGLLEVLSHLAALWQEKKAFLEDGAEQLVNRLRRHLQTGALLALELGESSRRAFEKLELNFDGESGGFGSAPKFPEPNLLFFLLRLYQREGNQKALDMAETTLLAIRAGGIYDQVGWGIHRYATDAAWRVPHFEKMLTDQALMSMVYVEAARITGRKIYRQTAKEILEYVLRDLRNEDGVFFSAEDADSEGKEGAFYTWSYSELKSLFDEVEFSRLEQSMEIFPDGNFRGMPGTDDRRENILFLRHPSFWRSGEFDSSVAEQLFSRLLDDDLRSRLFQRRTERLRPQLDKKIVTGSNGLMIAALARAGVELDNQTYLAAAEKAADWLLENHSGRRLLHHSINGRAGGGAFAEDYAFLVWGLLELFKGGAGRKFLDAAQRLSQRLMEEFYQGGMLFLTPADEEDVLFRMPADSDSSVPSAAAVQVMNLRRMGEISGEGAFFEMARPLSQRLQYLAGEFPGALLYFLAGE